ncbi:MAG: haloacid dehalogenase type II [Gemmobacter sp.]
MIRAVVFDAYGTLFDVAGATRAAATRPDGAALGPLWPRLAEDWRRKQLEYSWLRAIGGAHAGFDAVTADALDWAMAAQGLDDTGLRALLLSLYDRLPAYPEVTATLTALRASGLATAILSNGTPAMLSAATASAGIAGLFDAVISVEEADIFKPHPSVYALTAPHLAVTSADTLFVSSNGWDVAGAAAFGFITVWVNRAGLPVDRLPGRPAHVLPDLRPLPDLARTL